MPGLSFAAIKAASVILPNLSDINKGRLASRSSDTVFLLAISQPSLA